ncbi:hypothetical protein BDV95DRAFT_600110 [Massariosphaeria phaeospora]|uniref:Uncharacterized protein n=1 Tax=Massariosphaeria phaeospora TaxID=100035 RepID=A0A7C8I0W4_9PLEO|nr:hypothetical protein BDV95DRAFT_600110 [Massariosphaeria phaeospora]
MKLQNIFLAAACGVQVHGVYLLFTTPVPTAIPSGLTQEEALQRAEDWLKSQGPEKVSSLIDAEADLREFVATATYSIPDAVTDPAAFIAFTTPPEWYTALPSNIRKYDEEQVSLYASILSGGSGPKPTMAVGFNAGVAVAAVAAGAAFL